MKKWKKGIVLTTDRRGFPSQIYCAECCGIISPGTKFYIANYTTTFFHFNCVQTPENRVASDSELVKIKEELADVLSRKGVIEDDIAEVEREFGELERKESDLRKKIGKLVEAGGNKDDSGRVLQYAPIL